MASKARAVGATKVAVGYPYILTIWLNHLLEHDVGESARRSGSEHSGRNPSSPTTKSQRSGSAPGVEDPPGEPILVFVEAQYTHHFHPVLYEGDHPALTCLVLFQPDQNELAFIRFIKCRPKGAQLPVPQLILDEPDYMLRRLLWTQYSAPPLKHNSNFGPPSHVTIQESSHKWCGVNSGVNVIQGLLDKFVFVGTQMNQLCQSLQAHHRVTLRNVAADLTAWVPRPTYTYDCSQKYVEEEDQIAATERMHLLHHVYVKEYAPGKNGPSSKTGEPSSHETGDGLVGSEPSDASATAGASPISSQAEAFAQCRNALEMIQEELERCASVETLNRAHRELLVLCAQIHRSRKTSTA